MPVLVVFPGESLLVVLARGNGALLGPLRLMGEHVGLEVLEEATAVGMGAPPFFLGVIVQFRAAGGRAEL